MRLFAIRHKATGEFMPELERRGYSHWNPTTRNYPDNMTGSPRLLISRRKAERCIIQWAYNPNARQRFTTNYYGEDDIEFEIKPDGRTKTDLEVVEVSLKMKIPGRPFWEDMR
jgi:hypothetical protein